MLIAFLHHKEIGSLHTKMGLIREKIQQKFHTAAVQTAGNRGSFFQPTAQRHQGTLEGGLGLRARND